MQMRGSSGRFAKRAKRTLLIALAGLATLMAGPRPCSQAATYANREAFTAACQSLPGIKQEIPFEPYLYGNGQERDYAPSLTVSNVTFSGDILVRQDSISIAGEASLCNYDAFETPLAIHFENGALAFGADFSSLLWPSTSSFTATITVAGGGSFSFSCVPGPGSTFFGFTAGTPFHDLTYSDGGTFAGDLHEELIGDPFMVLMPRPAVLTSPSRLPDGSVQFTLEGNVGASYLIEVSTNLVTWSPLATLVATTGATPFVDATATNLNCRFYRALVQ